MIRKLKISLSYWCTFYHFQSAIQSFSVFSLFLIKKPNVIEIFIQKKKKNKWKEREKEKKKRKK